MSKSDSPKPSKTRRQRRDGWTVDRQLRFLQILATTRSVSRAAAHVRLSRESAYRLRSRPGCELFALAWDSVFAPRVAPADLDKVYMSLLPGGLGTEGNGGS